MTDEKTLAIYDERADEYEAAFDAKVPDDLVAFAAGLPKGGHVLDLGCGPGGMAAWLAAEGFDVLAWDASSEMVARAAARPGVVAEQRVFEDLAETNAFDGIGASFSLLHARRDDLPGLIERMARALRPEGLAYVAMKVGEGEARDAIGRRYAYVSDAELTTWMENAGLTVVSKKLGSGKGLAGTDDPFVTVTARA